MIDDIQKRATERMGKSIEALKHELAKIRTGRAHPSLLDHVTVSYYGNEVPLSQAANIAIEDARTLTVTPWERTMIQPIEKAIMTSDLGLNPNSAGTVIRVPMPPLTEQRRKDLAKLAKGHGEDAKVVIRKARHECRDMLKTIEDDGGASADDVERAGKAMEDLVKEGTAKVDEIVAAKEKDIMHV